MTGSAGRFEEFAAWKAAHMPWTRAAAELRITWEALANITARVAADASAGLDRLDGCGASASTRSPRPGQVPGYRHRPRQPGGSRGSVRGRCQATVQVFFDDLGEERAKALTHVSADGVSSIHPVVRAKAPQARLCLDAFHVVKWPVDYHAWYRLMRWIRAKYKGRTGLSMKQMRRRFCDAGWRFACNGVVFTGASSVSVTRYRYRGGNIPTPWTPEPPAAPSD